MRAAGLFCLFLSNLSQPDARGLLVLRPFHTHSCKRCPANICKHMLLSHYLRDPARDGVPFERLFYAGLGTKVFSLGVAGGG